MATATVTPQLTLDDLYLDGVIPSGQSNVNPLELRDHVPNYSEFIETMNRNIPYILNKAKPYDVVRAVFITWEDHDSPAIVESAKTLRDLMRMEYGYTTLEIQLKSKTKSNALRSQAQLSHSLSGEIHHISTDMDESGRESENYLFIIYYGGNGAIKRSDNKGVWFNRKSADPSYIEWENIAPIVTNSPCDVLFLFDCCYSTGIIPREVKWARRCEFLGASGTVEQTAASRNNFTSALIAMLKDVVKSRNSSQYLPERYLSVQHISVRLTHTNFCAQYGLKSTPQWMRLTTNTAIKSGILIAPQNSVRQSGFATNHGATNSPNYFPGRMLTEGDEVKKSLMELAQLSDAHVLLAVRFETSDEKQFVDEWKQWLGDTPQSVTRMRLTTPRELLEETIRNSVKSHCFFHSNSVLGIISVPMWLWSCLGPGSGWTLIDVIRSDENLVKHEPQLSAKDIQANVRRELGMLRTDSSNMRSESSNITAASAPPNEATYPASFGAMRKIPKGTWTSSEAPLLLSNRGTLPSPKGKQRGLLGLRNEGARQMDTNLGAKHLPELGRIERSLEKAGVKDRTGLSFRSWNLSVKPEVTAS